MITNDYITTAVKSSQRDKIGKVDITELQYNNGRQLTYKSLLIRYYVGKFKIHRNTVIEVIEGKTYQEIAV